MTKMMAANCDSGTPKDVTVVFPGQSQSSRGMTVLTKLTSTRSKGTKSKKINRLDSMFYDAHCGLKIECLLRG